ncbi:MAG: hypothetical protein GX568_02660 [Candidatus Gastranaerophilales bacterium]|nr:hypothetical protein [Candidatus Gastranaerophilales bacterium]
MILNTTQEQNKIIPHKDYKSASKGRNSSPAFGIGMSSAVNGAFIALERSEIMGPFFIDLFSMNIPRVAVDFTRGEAAGWESFRRETISTNNAFFMPYIYALGTGALLTRFKGPNLFVGNDMVKALESAWGNSTTDEEYVKDVLKKVKGLVNNKNESFSEESIAKLSKRLADIMNGKQEKGVSVKSVSEEAIKFLKAEKNIKVNENIETNIPHLFKNIVEVGKAYKKELKDLPRNSEKALSKINLLTNKIIKHGNIKSYVGMGLTLAGGFGLQYLNRYFTSKKTGSSAFVGLPDYEKNVQQTKQSKTDNKKKKSGSFWPENIAYNALMAYMTIGSVVDEWNPAKIVKELKPKKIADMFKMKHHLPTKNHFKLIIGPTLMGRILVADDKYELREAALRDSFTFLNFLILNDMVTKVSAYKMAKKAGILEKVFNGPVENVKNEKNFFTRSSMVLKELSTKTYKEIEAQNLGKQPIKIRKVSDMLGWGYALVLLGIGLPIINKFITNSSYNRENKQALSKYDLFIKKVSTAQGFGV